jgi:hypothetical protein
VAVATQTQKNMTKYRYRIEFNQWPRRNLTLGFRTMAEAYEWAQKQGGLEDIEDTRPKGVSRKQHLLRCATDDMQEVKTIGFSIRSHAE